MIANIALDDALILPHRANPRRIEFSGTTVHKTHGYAESRQAANGGIREELAAGMK
jgi:hypothetical protein